ncbi:MAG: hypothetical protein WBP13_07170 [Methylophilaceae bacterium]
MHPFYGEHVAIADNQISLQRNNGDNTSINLVDIDYITIYRFEYTDEHDRCWVNLRSYSKAAVSICTLAGYFNQVEKVITTWPNFDQQQYAAIRASKSEVPETVLWQKVHQANFSITPLAKEYIQADNLAMLQQGVFIENKQTCIAWGSYAELATQPLVKSKVSQCPNPLFSQMQYCIEKPTIFNGLQLSELTTACDAAEHEYPLHLPVIQYRAELSLGASRQASFEAIKTHIDAFFKVDQSKTQINDSIQSEAKGTWRAVWQSGDVKVTLYCFYRDELDGWDNIAWLNIDYSPNLDRFYVNTYQRNFVLTLSIQYEIFDFLMALYVDYRCVTNAIYTPSVLSAQLQDTQTIVWYDAAHQVIGFATKAFSLIFNANAVESIHLAVQNFRGSEGRNAIEIRYENKTVHLGDVDSTENFKKNIRKIEKIIGRKVATYIYDEHY